MSWVLLLMARGLESRAGVSVMPNSMSRDLSGEECGEEEGALGKVAK